MEICTSTVGTRIEVTERGRLEWKAKGEESVQCASRGSCIGTCMVGVEMKIKIECEESSGECKSDLTIRRGRYGEAVSDNTVSRISARLPPLPHLLQQMQ